MTPFTRSICVAAALATLTGCAAVRKQINFMGSWSPEPLMQQARDPVDLVAVLTNGRSSGTTVEPQTPAQRQQAFELAAAAFDAAYAGNAAEYRAQRSRVQDRLLMTTVLQCSAFKATMMRKQSAANFWLGSGALTLGAIAALTPHLATAQGLAGAAALTSGIRSEYNQDYWYDKTVAVIGRAIGKRQAEIMAEIDLMRGKERADYTLQRAIADVERMQVACSLAGALEFTERAIEEYDLTKSLDRRKDYLKRLEPDTAQAPPAAPTTAAAGAAGSKP